MGRLPTPRSKATGLKSSRHETSVLTDHEGSMLEWSVQSPLALMAGPVAGRATSRRHGRTSRPADEGADRQTFG